eukprot:447379_1
MSQNNQPDVNQIAKAFVEHYYNLFDNNRQGLGNLFQDSSMLSFENDGYKGRERIMQKLCQGVRFKQIQHMPKTLDSQPTGSGGLLVMVTGQLKIDKEQNPLLYSETFHLLPTDKSLKQWWVQNCIFRLNTAY